MLPLFRGLQDPVFRPRETGTLFIRSPPRRHRKVSVRNFRGTVREKIRVLDEDGWLELIGKA